MDLKMMPFISIIIPVFNGEKYVEKCLESVIRLEYPKESFEVIVVDNNSTDRTPDIIKKFPFKYCIEKKQGPSAARNLGVRIARGEILAFTDIDVIVKPNWLAQIAKAYKKHPKIDGFQGFSGGINHNIWAKLYQKWYEKGCLALQKKQGSRIKSLDTRNLAIKKSVLSQNGGFNEEYMRSEDNELGFRLYIRGYKIKFIPEIYVDHINPVDIWYQLCIKEQEYSASFKNFMTYDKKTQYLLRPQYFRFYYKLILSNNHYVLEYILPFINTMLGIAIKVMGFTLHFLNYLGLSISLYFPYSLSIQASILKGKIISRIEV
jgi:glycosyltransferase involved in cell wall biosynthesis